MYTKRMLISLVFLSCLQLSFCEGANILFFHLFSSYSHRIAVWPLVEALAAKGHNVTFLQSYPPKQPNPKVTEFYPESLGDIWKTVNEDGTIETFGGVVFNLRVEQGSFATQQTDFECPSFGLALCDQFLSLPETQDFVRNNRFDLVVIDALFNECAYGLAKVWDAKTVLYYTSHPSGVWGPETLGFLGTAEPPWISDLVVSYQMPLTFLHRLVTTATATVMHFMKEFYFYPSLDRLLKNKLNISEISVSKMVLETDLVLYNSHFSEELPRSLPPMFVAVPALHVWNLKVDPLPTDMADFIEGGGDAGFIYVSFGGLADITTAPQEFLNILYKAFGESKVRFVWKRNGERPKEMPTNVYTKDWMPQKDIIASPKCRGFITHGGQLGLQEALMNGVPMIALPIFADQEYNAYRLQRTGRGIKLELHTLTEAALKESIHEILNNRTYKENILKASRQLRDQQNSPIDTAVFWTEYTLRNDMSTLRPMKTRHSYWFQNYLLDVWAFLIAVAGAAVYGILWISKMILLFFSRRAEASKSLQKLKKS